MRPALSMRVLVGGRRLQELCRGGSATTTSSYAASLITLIEVQQVSFILLLHLLSSLECRERSAIPPSTAMSGLEIAAGGVGFISLSIQLGDSLVKLKRFYHAVKDAPQRLEMLIFELETMAIAMQELDQLRQESRCSRVLLDRCVSSCKMHTTRIQQVANSMSGRLTRRPRAGRLLIAAKDLDIQDLLFVLETAKSSLELAYMMFLSSEQRHRDQAHSDALVSQGAQLSLLQSQVITTSMAITQQLSMLTGDSLPRPYRANGDAGRLSKVPSTTTKRTIMQELATAETSDKINMTNQSNGVIIANGLKRDKSRASFRMRIRLPTWLSCAVWDLAVSRAEYGWTTHLCTYNRVPTNSLIFRYCASGNLAQVRQMIESGEASRLDVVQLQGGMHVTLLDVSISLEAISSSI